MGEIKKVLVPQYVKEFNCIGSDCEMSCCIGWNITVDKGTYLKYQKIDDKNEKNKDNKFFLIKNKKISRNKSKDSDYYTYASFEMTTDKWCPFLDENLLCDIYKNVGASNMPKTCRIYPRLVNGVAQSLEMSLTLSCPEAVRKCLLSEKTMEFEEIDLEIDEQNRDFFGSFYKNILIEPDSLKLHEEQAYFWDVRIPSITILQDRRFDIVSRLIIVGLLYKKVEKCIENKSLDEIPNTISNFMNMFNDMKKEDLDYLPRRDDKQSEILDALVGRDILGVSRDDMFFEYIDDFKSMIAKANTKDIPIEEYKRYSKDFQKFVEDNSHIFENYLVNEYFRLLMPFANFENIFDSLIVLASNYAIIRALSIGQISESEKFNQEDILKIITIVSKQLAHNSNYHEFILKNIGNYEFNTLGGLFTLICD